MRTGSGCANDRRQRRQQQPRIHRMPYRSDRARAAQTSHPRARPARRSDPAAGSTQSPTAPTNTPTACTASSTGWRANTGPGQRDHGQRAELNQPPAGPRQQARSHAPTLPRRHTMRSTYGTSSHMLSSLRERLVERLIVHPFMRPRQLIRECDTASAAQRQSRAECPSEPSCPPSGIAPARCRAHPAPAGTQPHPSRSAPPPPRNSPPGRTAPASPPGRTGRPS